MIKKYKVPVNGLSNDAYMHLIKDIPKRFDSPDNSLSVANEIVTIEGEFLTKEFEEVKVSKIV